MLYGPNLVIECHRCKTKLLVYTCWSTNSLDAIIWSDGRMERMDDFPRLARCHTCRTFIWVYEAPVLHKVDASEFVLEIDGETVPFPERNPLTLSDYKEALASGTCTTPSHEIYVRLNIWRVYNDRTRAGEALYQQNGDRLYYQTNLVALDALLCVKEERLEDQEEEEILEAEEQKILLRAECYRTRSKFEECLALLNELQNEDHQWLTLQLVSACKEKKTAVFVVKQPDYFYD